MSDAPLSKGASARWIAGVALAAGLGLFLRMAWIDERLSEAPRRGGWRAQVRLDPPLSKGPWLHDEQLYYLSTAVNQFQGRGFRPDYNRVRDGIFVPPPMQSFLILTVFRMAGGLVEPVTLLALQALLATLMVALVAHLARRLASPAAGLVCAFLVALHPDFVLWSGYLLTESNYLAGLCLLAVLLARWSDVPTLARGLPAAVVLGLLNLERPNAIWLALPLAFFALIRLGARRGMAPAILFMLVPMVVMLPWRQRNLKVYNEPIWSSSNVGIYLYIANNPRLDALATPYMDEANRGRRLLLPEIETRLRAPDGRLRVTYYRYSKEYTAAFLSYVREQPLHFLRNYLVKAAAQFWLVPDSRPVSDLFRIPIPAYRAVQRALILLGLCGLVVTLFLRPSPAAWSCALLLGYFAAAGGLAGLDLSCRYTLVVRFLLIVFFSTGLAIGTTALKRALR